MMYFCLPKSCSALEPEILCTISGPWSGALCAKIKSFPQNGLMMLPACWWEDWTNPWDGTQRQMQLNDHWACLSLQTCMHVIINQGVGKALHGFYSFKFFNNYHSDQFKCNKMQWSLVLFKTVGIFSLITTDFKFYIFSFCRVGEGCSAALVTPESGDCTFHGQ